MIQLKAVRAQRGMSTMQSVVAVAVGTVGLILSIVLLVQYSVASYGSRDVSGEAAMSPAAIAARIKPVGDIAMYDPAALPAPAPAAAAMPVALAGGAPAADKGEATFKGVCTGCHSAGVLGSPKFGDKAAWAPRIAQGMDALYEHAIKGKNSMPAKGGNPALADDDVKAAVLYMVKAAK